MKTLRSKHELFQLCYQLLGRLQMGTLTEEGKVELIEIVGLLVNYDVLSRAQCACGQLFKD